MFNASRFDRTRSSIRRTSRRTPGRSAAKLSANAGQAHAEHLEPRQLLATFFVDADATGAANGTSWMNAFTSLTAAITAASANDDIWIAQGTYTPGGTRGDTFELKAGVELYGGFAGTEVSRNARNPGANPVTLSGEIGAAGTGDNSYHVVTASGNLSGAVLAGVTISNGNANGGGDDSQGGGIRLDNASGLDIQSDVTVTNNSATTGGGIYSTGGGATIAATITGNTATGDGGGYYAIGGVGSFTGTATSNTATGNGGGIYLSTGGSFTFNGLNIASNMAGNGGGIYVGGGVGLTLTNTTISSNAATNDGGGLFNVGTLTINNSTITGNTATSDGGGLYNQGTATFNSGTATTNTAGDEGGGIANSSGTLTLAGGTINANTAANGGGLAITNGGSWSFTGSPITNNNATADGGGLYVEGGTTSLGGSTLIGAGNTADGRGGTIFVDGGTLNIENANLNNGATPMSNGGSGGVAAVVNGTLNVSNSTFINQRATADGGALYANTSTVNLFNNKFLGIVAQGNGGAVSIKGNSNATIANNVFSGNFGGGFGGALEIGGGSATLVNNTAAFNFASNVVSTAVFNGNPVNANDLAATTNGFGGFAGIRSGATVLIANSVIWDNTAVLPSGSVREFQVYVQSGATVTVQNSLILAGLPTRAIDGGNIQQVDPVFVETGAVDDGSGVDQTPGTADDNFDLGTGSVAIDAADPSDLPADILDVDNDGNTTEALPIDINGRGRVGGVTLDMGAYESDNAGVTPPEPGAPTTTALRGFPSSNEGDGSSDSFPINQGFDLVAIGVQDGDGDLARVEFYFDSNNNGVLEPGTDQLLGSVAYAEDGPGGGNTFDPTIDDDGFVGTTNVGFDGIADPIQGAAGIDNVPESFIYRLTNAQVTGFGAGAVRFFARGVDASGLNGPAEELLIVLDDGSPDAEFSLIIGGGAQRPIAAQIPFGTADRPEVIQLGDLDGDGLADAVVTTEAQSNVVTIWYGQGDGTFTDRFDVTVGPRPEDVVLRDFNNDGRLDFATSDWPVNRPGDGSVTIALNQGGRGAAAFPASAVTSIAARGLRFSLDAGDLDNDGDIDLIAANLQTDNATDIFLNNGNGGFSRINGPNTNNAAIGRIRVADLNNDGNLDVAYTQVTGGIVLIYAPGNEAYVSSGGALRVGSTSTVSFPQNSKRLRGLRFGDLNDDGFVDMVVSNQDTNQIAVYLNDGTGGFGAGTLYTVGSRPEDIAIGDFNNDTIPDIATANTSSANMSLLTNNGDGTFQPAITLQVGSGPEGVAIGDVTNDGANDIVTANIGADTISFLKNSIGRRSAVGTENAAGTNFVGIINQTANPVVFEQDANGDWLARRVNTGTVFLVGQMTAVTVDGNQHFFATGSNGLRWFFPKNDGTGEYFDLDLASIAGVPASVNFSFSLSNFIDPQGNPHLFGLTEDGEYVTVRRTGVSGGNWIWQYENITQSVANNNPGVTIPTLLEFEPYATRWNQWGIAGIADNGDVISIWTTPSFNFWTLSNLSDEVRDQFGADVPLMGGLATVITRRFDIPPEQQTQWDGINIGGLTGSGNLRVLWWAAANVNTDPNNLDSGWRISDLTDPQATAPNSGAMDLPAFAPERGLSSYFTPWGGINYVGFSSTGQIQVYWWVPGFAGQYISSIITDTLPQGTLTPVADLNAYSAPNGIITVFGPGPADETLRLWVDPFAPGTSWGVDNLSEISTRVL